MHLTKIENARLLQQIIYFYANTTYTKNNGADAIILMSTISMLFPDRMTYIIFQTLLFSLTKYFN